MKKIWVVLIALTMLLCAAFAIAEETAVYEFEGFTIEMEKDIINEVYERLDGQILFIVYPQCDENSLFPPHLICWWSEEGTVDWGEVDDVSKIAQILVSGINADGSGYENVQVLEGGHLEIDAVKGIGYTCCGDFDLSALGYDQKITFYMKFYHLSDEDIGTYSFMLSAADPEMMETMDAYVASVRWD